MSVPDNINGKEVLLKPTANAQSFTADGEINSFEVNRNFYVNTEKKIN